jgi:hypothetical protein
MFSSPTNKKVYYLKYKSPCMQSSSRSLLEVIVPISNTLLHHNGSTRVANYWVHKYRCIEIGRVVERRREKLGCKWTDTLKAPLDETCPLLQIPSDQGLRSSDFKVSTFSHWLVGSQIIGPTCQWLKVTDFEVRGSWSSDQKWHSANTFPIRVAVKPT